MFFRFYGMDPTCGAMRTFEMEVRRRFKVLESSSKPMTQSVNAVLPTGENRQLDIEFVSDEERDRFRADATLKVLYRRLAYPGKGAKFVEQNPKSMAFNFKGRL